MNHFLELGEHGLAIKRPANVIDLSIYDVGAHFRIARLLQQEMSKEFFVKGASNFGQKDRVIVILKELRSDGEPGVHGVAGLVCQGINVGEHILLVIHQDIRRRVVAAGGEGATAFSLCLVTIAPAAAQAIGQRMRVFMAERRKRRDDLVDCFVESDVGFDFLN